MIVQHARKSYSSHCHGHLSALPRDHQWQHPNHSSRGVCRIPFKGSLCQIPWVSISQTLQPPRTHYSFIQPCSSATQRRPLHCRCFLELHTRTTGQPNEAFLTCKIKTQGKQKDTNQKKYPGLAESPHTKTEIFMQLLYQCKDLAQHLSWPLLEKIVLIKTKAKGQSPTALKIDVSKGKT